MCGDPFFSYFRSIENDERYERCYLGHSQNRRPAAAAHPVNQTDPPHCQTHRPPTETGPQMSWACPRRTMQRRKSGGCISQVLYLINFQIQIAHFGC